MFICQETKLGSRTQGVLIPLDQVQGQTYNKKSGVSLQFAPFVNKL